MAFSLLKIGIKMGWCRGTGTEWRQRVQFSKCVFLWVLENDRVENEVVGNNAGGKLNLWERWICHHLLPPSLSLSIFFFKRCSSTGLAIVLHFFLLNSVRESDDVAHYYCWNPWHNKVLSIESAWTLRAMAEQKDASRERWGLMSIKLLNWGINSTTHSLFS